MAKVTFIESATTSTGKPYKKVTLDTEVLGKNKFNVFSFHTRYADVAVGRAFDESEFEQDGQYIKLRDPDAGIKRGFGGRSKGPDPMVIAQAQEHKAELIRGAQDSKQESIKISSTARDATLITVALMSRGDIDWEEKWLEVRKWLLNNFDTVVDPGEIPF